MDYYEMQEAYQGLNTETVVYLLVYFPRPSFNCSNKSLGFVG
jgi:hypothetical protein